MSPARARTRTTRSGVELINHEATAPPTSRPKVRPKSKIYVPKRDVKRSRSFHVGILPPEKIHTNLPEDLTKMTYFLPEMKLQLDKASKSLE